MPNRPKTTSDLPAKRDALLDGILKHARSATLAAALVPIAMVAAAPSIASAQGCDPSADPGCDTVTVPEPGTLLLLAPAAAGMLMARARNKKKRENE